jgi:hypothetical protein
MLKESASRENKLSIKLGLVQSKLSKAESALEEKMDELSHLKHDLEVLGEKLTDALEQRAELIHSKEAVNDEIEDLTRNLFEEANNLVANEAKQKLEHQQKVALFYPGRRVCTKISRMPVAFTSGANPVARTSCQVCQYGK